MLNITLACKSSLSSRKRDLNNLHYLDFGDLFRSLVKTSYKRTKDRDNTSSHIVDDLKKCCTSVNSVQLLCMLAERNGY